MRGHAYEGGTEATYLSLLDAVLLRHGTLVKLPHRLVLEEITATDLAIPFVRSSVTRLQTDDIRETPAVRERVVDGTTFPYSGTGFVVKMHHCRRSKK